MSETLKLTPQELQTAVAIAASSDQPLDQIVKRLELLTWRDGLAEFRMQSSGGLLPWMEHLLALSDRVNQRLEQEGIPLGPNRTAYAAWLAKRPTDSK